MRILIGLFLLIGQISFADETQLGDLNFLLSPGKSVTGAALLLTKGEGDLSFNGAVGGSVETSLQQLRVKYAYGITENGQLEIGTDFLKEKMELEIANLFTFSGEDKGIDDPSISYTHRIMSEEYLVDLSGEIQPSIIKAKEGDGDQDGTNADGATEVGLEFAVGKEMEKMGFRGSVSLEHNMKGEAEDSDGNTVETEAHKQVMISGEYQYKGSEQFRLGARLDLVNKDSYEEDTNGSKSEIPANKFKALSLIAWIFPQPDWLITTGLVFTKIDDVEFPSVSGLKLEDNSWTSFLVGVEHTF